MGRITIATFVLVDHHNKVSSHISEGIADEQFKGLQLIYFTISEGLIYCLRYSIIGIVLISDIGLKTILQLDGSYQGTFIYCS